MTYYEEFGISSQATTDEIHHAHRRLIKILHPDLQTEELTRHLAEIQTRRINGIAQILLDPSQRKGYETSLLPPPPPRPVPGKQYCAPVAFVVAALSVTALLPFVFPLEAIPIASKAVATKTTSPAKAMLPPAATPNAASTPLTPSIQAPSSKSKRPNDLTRPGDIESATQIKSLDMDPSGLELAGPQMPSLAETGGASENQRQHAVLTTQTENPLIGTWIYVPSPMPDEDKKVYRPEYIEMRIRNVRGVLEGQYRARYHVPDRPLSPNVGFHFAGQFEERLAGYRWSGSNGLAGQVQLKLMTANSIQVDWRVTESTELADLVSGTAVLTRVQ